LAKPSITTDKALTRERQRETEREAEGGAIISSVIRRVYNMSIHTSSLALYNISV